MKLNIVGDLPKFPTYDPNKSQNIGDVDRNVKKAMDKRKRRLERNKRNNQPKD